MKSSWILIGVLALASCDRRPDHAEWQNVCVQSHDEFSYFSTTYISCGNGCMTPIMTPIYDTVCDRYEVRCVGGKDGSTVCPTRGAP